MSRAAEAATATGRLRIWDGPTRIFHWAITLLIPAMWWTAENDQIGLHVTLGIVMVGLLVFRLVWGMIGSRTARFASFVKGPRAVIAYLRGDGPSTPGHSPLGALSVIAMLAVLVIQVGLGLFAEDNDGLAAGPLSSLVSADTAETLTDRHEFMFNVLLALIALHLAAVLYYLAVRRRNLIWPMITGHGPVSVDTEPMRKVSVLRIALALALSVGVAAWLWSRL